MSYHYQPCYSKVSSLSLYGHGLRLYFLLRTIHIMLNFQWLLKLLFFCKAAVKSKPSILWQICILHLDFVLKKLKILSYDLVILGSYLRKWVFNFYTILFLSRWPYRISRLLWCVSHKLERTCLCRDCLASFIGVSSGDNLIPLIQSCSAL